MKKSTIKRHEKNSTCGSSTKVISVLEEMQPLSTTRVVHIAATKITRFKLLPHNILFKSINYYNINIYRKLSCLTKNQLSKIVYVIGT